MKSLDTYIIQILEKYGTFNNIDDVFDDIAQKSYDSILDQFNLDDDEFIKKPFQFFDNKKLTIEFDGSDKTFYNKCTIYINQFGFNDWQAGYDNDSVFENGKFHIKLAMGMVIIYCIILSRLKRFKNVPLPGNIDRDCLITSESIISHELMHAYEDYCKRKKEGRLIASDWYIASQKLKYKFMENQEVYNFLSSIYILEPAECRANIQALGSLIKSNIDNIDTNYRNIDEILIKLSKQSSFGHTNIMFFINKIKPFINDLSINNKKQEEIFKILDNELSGNSWWSKRNFVKKVKELKRTSDHYYDKIKSITSKIFNDMK